MNAFGVTAKATCLALCLGLAAWAVPQGGQGGFQGGTDEGVRQLLLTPGDRTEWTFEAKDNETVIVRVSSGVFDPALAILDADDKKLAENDDVEPGNQMALLVYSVPKAGKYKAVVTNYKGTAGGPFDFSVRRFLSVGVALGDSVVAGVGDRSAWVRVDLPKEGAYVVTGRGAGAYGVESLAQNGGGIPRVQVVGTKTGYYRARFQVDKPGVHYFWVGGAHKPAIRVAPLTLADTKVGDDLAGKLGPDEVVEWSLAAQAGETFEVSLADPSEELEFDFIPDVPAVKGAYRLVSRPSLIRRYGVAMLESGVVVVRVRHRDGDPADYRIKTVNVNKPMPTPSVSSSLAWQGSDYWTFVGKPGDVVQLEGVSDVYSMDFLVVDPAGRVMNAAHLGRTPKMGLTFTVQRAGQHVVHVNGGGIGAYRLARRVIEPKRLNFGGSEGVAKANTPDVWRFAGKEGQDVVLRIAAADLRWSVAILGPEGNEVGRLDRGYAGNDDFARLRLGKSGDYTVVVTSQDESVGPYRLRLVDLDR